METFVISFNQPHFGLFFMKKSFQNHERLRIYFLYLLPAKFAAQHCIVADFKTGLNINVNIIVMQKIVFIKLNF